MLKKTKEKEGNLSSHVNSVRSTPSVMCELPVNKPFFEKIVMLKKTKEIEGKASRPSSKQSINTILKPKIIVDLPTDRNKPFF